MRFEAVRNDIAHMQVDAVVLPANPSLSVGGGASRAIFEAAGRERLEAECAERLQEAREGGLRLEPGITVPTSSYDLPTKAILHTIVPEWREGQEGECYVDLCRAYASALVMADEAGCETIAFPVLASGGAGFDPDFAVDVALRSLEYYQPRNTLELAYLVTYDEEVTGKVRERGIEVTDVIGDEDMWSQTWEEPVASWAIEVSLPGPWGQMTPWPVAPWGVGLRTPWMWGQMTPWPVAFGDVEREAPWEQWGAMAPFQTFVDEAFRWMADPENQMMVLRRGLDVARLVIPEGHVFRQVIDAIDETITEVEDE